MFITWTRYTVCDNFTYGEQCSKRCACNRTNAVGCDAVSGECTCNSKWEGKDCSVDIDECKRGTKICGSDLHVCVNTPGSAICECRYGGTDLNNCVRKYAIYLKELGYNILLFNYLYYNFIDIFMMIYFSILWCFKIIACFLTGRFNLSLVLYFTEPKPGYSTSKSTLHT